MRRPKLLAVDLDGTLLDARGQPHGADVNALRAAIAAGVRVSIITGRLYSGTRRVAELLHLRGAVGCADGSHLVDSAAHATLLHVGVAAGDSRVLRGALARARLTTFVFAQDAIGHDAEGVSFVDYVKTWSEDLRPSLDVFEHALWDADDGVTAVVAVGALSQIEQAAVDIARDLSLVAVFAKFPIRRATHPGMWAIIIRAAGSTKGTALQWIARHEQVALEDTVCIGDWVNDISMFEQAGRSFAMGQAPDDVKAKATDVLSQTVAEGGGVACAIEQSFGIALS